MQRKVRAVIMRGGTSKGIFFLKEDLDSVCDARVRDEVLLSIFGSPDPMQINGLGGATSHTSKLMIVTRSQRPGHDLDYTFGQVAIDSPIISYSGNCGNLTSAVGPYAVDERLVEGISPRTRVTLYNTNTAKTVIAEFPVVDGKALSEGDFEIDGVPGKGARVRLGFVNPGGAITGQLLPTGNPIDTLKLDGKVVECSIVDAATLCTFVKAEDLGLLGNEPPSEVGGSVLAAARKIRETTARRLRLLRDGEDIRPTIPGEVVVISDVRTHAAGSGGQPGTDRVDVVARLISIQGRVHHAFPVTGALCTAAAAGIAGTLVSRVAKPGLPGRVIIAHPKGAIEVGVEAGEAGKEYHVKVLSIDRTARRLMDGFAYFGDQLHRRGEPDMASSSR